MRFGVALIAATCLAPMQTTWAGGVVAECSQAALESALTGGGTVTFACDGVLTLSNTLNITEDVLLDGTGRTVTLSGNNAVRLFTVSPGVRFSLVNLTIANGLQSNTNSSCGGAVFNDGGAFAATNCVFIGNRVAATAVAAFGGAICNSNGTAILVRCGFIGNRALGGDGQFAYDPGKDGSGGAIHNGNGSLVVIGSSFVANKAQGGYGPGRFRWSASIGGTASGGAVFSSGQMVMTNSTLATNSAVSGYGMADAEGFGGAGRAFGGAVCNDGGTTTVACVTIAGNTAVTVYRGHPTLPQAPGGGIYTYLGALTLANSILASNLAILSELMYNRSNLLANGNCYGSIYDGGHNLSSDSSIALTNTGSMTNTDPRLGPLGDHGGPTSVLPLLEGSPAIDAGDDALTNSVVTDQRGYARLSGPHVDIGAVEYQRVILPLRIDSVSHSAEGGAQLAFQNSPDGPVFTVLAATNIALPATDWTNLGLAEQTAPGRFRFADTNAADFPRRFYQLRSP